MELDGCGSMPSEDGFGYGYSNFYCDYNSRGDFSSLLRGCLTARVKSSACDVHRLVQKCFSGLGNGRSGGVAVPDLAFLGLTLFIFLLLIGYVRFCERMN